MADGTDASLPIVASETWPCNPDCTSRVVADLGCLELIFLGEFNMLIPEHEQLFLVPLHDDVSL